MKMSEEDMLDVWEDFEDYWKQAPAGWVWSLRYFVEVMHIVRAGEVDVRFWFTAGEGTTYQS